MLSLFCCRLRLDLVSSRVTLPHNLTEGDPVDGLTAVGGQAEPLVVLQHLGGAEFRLADQELQILLVQERCEGSSAGTSALMISHLKCFEGVLQLLLFLSFTFSFHFLTNRIIT